MRSTMLLLIASVFVLSGAANGQPQYFKGASPEARRANQHYKSGWEAMRRESWDEAANSWVKLDHGHPRQGHPGLVLAQDKVLAMLHAEMLEQLADLLGPGCLLGWIGHA